MNTSQARVMLGAAILTIGSWATALWAAEAEDSLEEIVVTAEKRETNLQKTAISIQVTSGEQLRQEGKRRIDEIMQGTVGVQFQTNQFGANVFMRGLGNVEGIPGGGEKAVATIIDGAYQYRTEVLSNGTLDVAQVEVMRGAQSTNLGAGSLAGAVSLVSNQPIFQYQASGSLELGDYNLVNTEGVLNLPLSDTQAIRAAYSTGKRDGYVSSGAGGNDNTNARLKYRWQPNQDLNIVLTGNYQRSFVLGRGDAVAYSGYYELANATDTYDSTIGYPAAVGHVSNSTTFRQRADAWDDGFPYMAWPNTPYRANTVTTFSGDVDWKTGIGTLTLTPQVQRLHSWDTEVPGSATYLHEDSVETSRQMEARLASNPGSRLQWLGGLYYYYRDTPASSYQIQYAGTNDMGTACAVTQGNCYTANPMGLSLVDEARTESAYGNFTYSLYDTLRLIGGLRYSRDTKHSEVVETTGSTTVTSGSWSETTYRAGLEYDVLPQSMLYATYSTGYQPGSINMGALTDKQTTEQISLGMKNRFLDNTLQLNVEAFDTKYHNRPLQGSIGGVIVTEGGADGSTTAEQQGCASQGGGASTQVLYVNPDYSCVNYTATVTVPDYLSKGVDVDLSWVPTSSDRLDFTAEYLKSTEGALGISFTAAQLQAALTSAATGTSNDLSNLTAAINSTVDSYDGLTPQNSPLWSLNGTYQHRFTLANGSSITPKLNGIYKSKYWSQGGGPGANIANPGLAYQDAYTLWHAYLGWESRDGKWNVTAYVKNVANEVIQINYAGAGPGGPATVQLDAPRTFGVVLNASL